MDGFFSENGHPIIPVEVYGFSKEMTQKFNAMIDTGFSGFLSLPLAHAFKVGLILASTASFTLADGSTDSTLLCYGTIKLSDEEEQQGLIAISKGNDVLLGMEFLRKFCKKLVLDYQNQTVKLE